MSGPPDAGVAAACGHVLALRAARVVDGLHLLAVSRAGELARRPGPLLVGG